MRLVSARDLQIHTYRTPARYLADGDVVELTVGGERLSNPVVAP